jgi:phytoene dehydrogenase-like protein
MRDEAVGAALEQGAFAELAPENAARALGGFQDDDLELAAAFRREDLQMMRRGESADPGAHDRDPRRRAQDADPRAGFAAAARARARKLEPSPAIATSASTNRSSALSAVTTRSESPPCARQESTARRPSSSRVSRQSQTKEGTTIAFLTPRRASSIRTSSVYGRIQGVRPRRDWKANEALQSEIAALRDDLAPTWLQEPLSIEETAARFVRPALRQPFIDLCRKPIGDYLERFDFKSDLVKAMYAVTDGFSGLYGTWDTPGTGMNFLVHNMCRLPDSGGTWMIVEGGMGTIAQRFADAARREGARIETRQGVKEILVERNAVRGVVTSNGDVVRATTVVVNADPFRMREMVGASTLPADYNARLDNYKMPGSTFKLNLALKSLPSFTCLPENKGPFGPTIHLLPDEDVVMKSLLDSFRAVQNGELPDFPAIEWYIHTTVDPTVKDAEGHHSSALFVQWVPYELKGKRWEDEEARYAQHLLSICDRFAPGTSDLVVDMMVLHPKSIERYFGITQGHIHHVDNSFGFADRLPYAQPISGLYSCSAGTHPAGSVIGCAGHNAAMRVLKDLSHTDAHR